MLKFDINEKEINRRPQAEETTFASSANWKPETVTETVLVTQVQRLTSDGAQVGPG